MGRVGCLLFSRIYGVELRRLEVGGLSNGLAIEVRLVGLSGVSELTCGGIRIIRSFFASSDDIGR